MAYARSLASAALLFLAACDSGLVSEAKDHVRHDMLDPDATEFRDVELCSADKAVVRGDVNGKNRFGAFVGFKPFYYSAYSVIYAETPEEYTAMTRRCFGPEVSAEVDAMIKEASESAD